MKRFFRSLTRSILATLFLTLVCGGFLGLVAVPAIGKRLAAPLCESSVTVEETRWSQPNGESGTNIRYLCTAQNGVTTPISTGQIFLRAATYYVGALWLVVWPLIFLASFFLGYGKFIAKTQHLREQGIPATARIINTSRSRVTYNSRSEHDVGVIIELEIDPPDGAPYRAKSNETLHVTDLMKLTPGMQVGVHIDPKKRERVAITSWNLSGMAVPSAHSGRDNFTAQVGNQVGKLQQLKQMLDSGLISQAEFERKKDEILSNL